MIRIEEGSQLAENLQYIQETLLGKTKKQIEIDGKLGPVIGVHGVFGGWTENSLRKYLFDKNIKASLPNFGYLLEGIDSYLSKIHEEVLKYPNAILFGFSAGGLSLLRYADKFGWEGFEKIITVGTPFNGVSVRPFLRSLGKTFEDISPGSLMLEQIKRIEPPAGKVLSIFSMTDGFMPNPESTKFNWPTVVLGTKSHGNLQNHSVFLENVLDAELGIKDH